MELNKVNNRPAAPAVSPPPPPPPPPAAAPQRAGASTAPLTQDKNGVKTTTRIGKDDPLRKVIDAGPTRSSDLSAALASRRQPGTVEQQREDARAYKNDSPAQGVDSSYRVLPSNTTLGVAFSGTSVDAQAARAKLSPQDQQRYDRVAASLPNEFGPHRELEKMLTDGRLTDPGAKDAQGNTLLGALDKLAADPVAPGLDKASVMSDVVNEIANPASIQQGSAGTCAATVPQIALARENPAEYARVMAGLASPDGKVKLANGETMQRVPGTEKAGTINVAKPGEPPDEVPDKRSDTGRLFQSAAMQLAHGSQETYSAHDDAFVSPAGKPSAAGLSGDEGTHLTNALGLTTQGKNVTPFNVDPAAAKQLEGVRTEADKASDAYHAAHKEFQAASDASSKAYEAYKADPSPANTTRLHEANAAFDVANAKLKTASAADDKAAAALKKAQAQVRPALQAKLAAAIAKEVAKGREVQVGVDWGAGRGGHEILVTKMDAKQVVFNNPQGMIETMPRAEFDRRVRDATL